MKFSSYLDPQYIFTDLHGDDITQIISEMVDRIAKSNKIVANKKDVIKDAILKREHEMSTGIGNGIAIPHARIENLNDFIVAVGVLDHPIKEDIACTGKQDEVTLVFLIISDILKNKNILKCMSAVSKIAIKNKSLLEKIKHEHNPKKILDDIKEANIELDSRIIAEDVLSPDVRPAHPNDTLEHIAKRFILENASGLPVVDDGNVFLGEITERELIAYGMPSYLSLMKNLNFLTVGEPFEDYLKNESTVTIKDLYRDSKEVVIDSQTPIMEICFKMVHEGMTRLYVVDDGCYIGMIKRSDIIKKVLHL